MTYTEIADALQEPGPGTAAFYEACDEAAAILRSLDAQPVAWVNQANLNSAAIQRNRGGQGDTHTWSETPTQYHSVPLYAAPVAAPQSIEAQDQEENIAADAYNHACDEMEAWQHKRHAAGKEVGTTGSLCDGIAWLYSYIDKLEALATPVAARLQQAKSLSDAEIDAMANSLFQDYMADKNDDFDRALVRAAITAFCQKNGIKEQG